MDKSLEEYFNQALKVDKKFKEFVLDYIAEQEAIRIKNLSHKDLKLFIKHGFFINGFKFWKNSEIVKYLGIETLEELKTEYISRLGNGN